MLDPIVHIIKNQVDPVKSNLLTTQLSEYWRVRDEERKLRTRVEFLTKQASRYGPLKLEVDLALLLKEENEKLNTIRREIESREEKLRKLESLASDDKKAMASGRLERLVSDIKAKRELISIHQENINFLEEKRAKYGLDTPLDLANELKLIQVEHEKVLSELKQKEQQLKEEWGIEISELKDIDNMDEEQVEAFVSKKVSQKEEVLNRRRELLEQRAKEQVCSASEKYDDLVLAVLEEIRSDVYSNDPLCKIGKGLYCERSFKDQPKQAGFKWEISFVGSFVKISVFLDFDEKFKLTNFRCVKYDSSGIVTRTIKADLSIESLSSALRELHNRRLPQKGKKWWAFWRKSPESPEDSTE